MTRNEKLRKLGNAVREYRGAYEARSGKWVYAPKRDASDRVRHWLSELNFDVGKGLKFIDECKTLDQFRTWVSAL